MKDITVRGEISNLSARSLNGHIYFSLKDEDSVLRCVMFAGRTRTLKFLPEDGMRVMATGDVSVYEKGGQYQLIVSDLSPDGEGALALRFEQLRRKLAGLGLFDETHKKPIPRFPANIGIISALGSAALADLTSILDRRWPSAHLTIAPSVMQGKDSPASVIASLKKLSALKPDVIVIARGGGSAEDLWCFNDEALAYAIYACPIPVVSAVGHEVDYTIADFVADLRAPTPSAAAELISPDRSELLDSLKGLENILSNRLSRRLRDREMALDMLSLRMEKVSRHRLQERRNTLALLSRKTAFLRPPLEGRRERLKVTGAALDRSFRQSLTLRSSRLTTLNARLEALSPLRVLERGYAVVLHHDKAVTDSREVSPGEPIQILLHRGTLDAVVSEE